MTKGGLFLLLCLMGTSVFAQTNMDIIFQKENPNIIYQNEPHPFDGNPLVYLEGTSDVPQPKTWKDKLKVKLFGSMEIPKTSGPELDILPTVSIENTYQNKVEIKPAFGPKKEVAFVPHTPDWHFVITTTDNNVFNIHEELSFIVKEEMGNIIRDWPVKTKNFQLIQAKLDGQFPLYNLKAQEDKTTLLLPPIKTGAHKIQLDYLIITPSTDKNILIPLIGTNWPFIADTFSGVILTNQNKLEVPQFLIGTNNQKFPENFSISQDQKGNIFFKMNKILPAKTQIQLETKSNTPLGESPLNQSFAKMFLFLMIFILCIYVLASSLEIKYMSLEKRLKKFHHFPTNSFLSFIDRNKEIMIGCFMLILFGFIFNLIYQISITPSILFLLIIISSILIFISDYFIIHPVQKDVFKMHQIQQERKS